MDKDVAVDALSFICGRDGPDASPRRVTGETKTPDVFDHKPSSNSNVSSGGGLVLDRLDGLDRLDRLDGLETDSTDLMDSRQGRRQRRLSQTPVLGIGRTPLASLQLYSKEKASIL